MKIGYIRVSTAEQNIARQEVLMQELGVEKVFIDQMSGKNTNRPELQQLLSFARSGDTVIIMLKTKTGTKFDWSVVVMADVAASVLAKLKNKAKVSGISYQQCLQLFVQEEFLRRSGLVNLFKKCYLAFLSKGSNSHLPDLI